MAHPRACSLESEAVTFPDLVSGRLRCSPIVTKFSNTPWISHACWEWQPQPRLSNPPSNQWKFGIRGQAERYPAGIQSEKQLDAIQQDMKLLTESGIEPVVWCGAVSVGGTGLAGRVTSWWAVYIYRMMKPVIVINSFSSDWESCKALGVQFVFDTEAWVLNHHNQTIESITTTQGEF